MEGRHFRIGGGRTVKEGNITLEVANRLKVLLEQHEFKVFLVRDNLEPVTSDRPIDFEEPAKKWAEDRLGKNADAKDIQKMTQKRREMLFYRISEINALSS